MSDDNYFIESEFKLNILYTHCRLNYFYALYYYKYVSLQQYGVNLPRNGFRITLVFSKQIILLLS